jgi:hypothetical protein
MSKELKELIYDFAMFVKHENICNAEATETINSREAVKMDRLEVAIEELFHADVSCPEEELEEDHIAQAMRKGSEIIQTIDDICDICEHNRVFHLLMGALKLEVMEMRGCLEKHNKQENKDAS